MQGWKFVAVCENQIKYNRDIWYTIQEGKLILISECYENRGENRLSDSRHISSPAMHAIAAGPSRVLPTAGVQR